VPIQMTASVEAEPDSQRQHKMAPDPGWILMVMLRHSENSSISTLGRMAERFKAPVLKFANCYAA